MPTTKIRESEKIFFAEFICINFFLQRINTNHNWINNCQSRKEIRSSIKGIREKLLTGKLKFKNQTENFPDWQTKTIADVLKIGSGKDYRHLGMGAIPVFGTGGLMTHVDSFLYEGETVCIGRKGTIDKPMYYSGKIWTVDTLFYTHAFVNVLPKFIFYIFQLINWLQYNEASGVPSLSKNTIEKIQVNIPSYSEQTLIADSLSLIDEKIETERNILLRYERQKKYLLQNMFI